MGLYKKDLLSKVFPQYNLTKQMVQNAPKFDLSAIIRGQWQLVTVEIILLEMTFSK